MIVIRTRTGEVHIIQSAIIRAVSYKGKHVVMAFLADGEEYDVVAGPYETRPEAEEAALAIFNAIAYSAEGGNPIITINLEALGIAPKE